MIQVTEKAETLEKGIENLIAGAKEDYPYGEWDGEFSTSNGRKYIKIIRDGGAFAFIVKKDFEQFKEGDVLFVANWKTPALNQARGNVLDGNYPIEWTGPVSLRRY
tara:strand:- start:548 stop:865 length:318 start_codon:yes stop_codon:yes gene_type:complete